MLNRLFGYSDDRRTCIVISAIALAVYVVTAYANYGFHHADELFQIIEYAGIKSETFTPCIAWEYEAQIRPMLQPAICACFLKFFSLFSVSDPFVISLAMRLFTALISFLAILLFVKNTACRIQNQRHRTIYLALSLLMWFIPYIACRFSSETFGGISLLFALAIYFSEKKGLLLRILLGFCLALSFIFRFQMGVAIFGFGLWALIIDKRGWRYFLAPAISFFLAYLALGVGVDSWFYGGFVFTPYNYVKVNSEVSAAWFGSEPWWFYLYNLVSYPTYFVGIPLAIAIIYLLLRNPKNPYLWCFIPFLIVHSVVAHKEVRFLFPMAFLFPAMLMSAFELLNRRFDGKRLWKAVCYVLVFMFLTISVVGLCVNMTKSAGQQTCYLAKYINDNYKDEKVNIVHGLFSNPYGPYAGISGFYRNENAIMQKFNSIYGIKLLLRSDAVNFFTCRKCDLEKMVCVGEFAGSEPFAVLEKLGFVFVSQSMPKFSEKICKYYSGFDDSDVLYVFRYEGKEYKPSASDYKEAALFYSDCERGGVSGMAYSGECSSLVCGEKCYSLGFTDSLPQLGDVENLSVSMFVYQYDTIPQASVVFELLGDENMRLWNAVKTVDLTSKTNQWVNITANFGLPDNFKDYSRFKVYLFNPTETPVYCDDIFAVFY